MVAPFLFMLSASGAQAAGSCVLADLGPQGWVLRNEAIARRIPRPQDLPCAAEVWPVGGHGIAFEDRGFLIRLEGGVELGPGDFEWEPQPDYGEFAGGYAGWWQGAARTVPLRVRTTYLVMPGEPFLRKRLHLQATSEPVLVRDVQVERLRTPLPTDLGGFGQPIFLDNRAFLGLEYPAAENLVREGLVTLEHHPGVRLEPGADWWISKPAVIGMTEGQEAQTAFRRYVAGIRRPARPLVVYNSWYDVQRGEMSVPVLIGRAKQLHEELTAKRGAPFDAVVLDDGWQDVQSIWEIDRQGFPNGFRELHEALAPMGVAIGLWHPLTAINGNLDTAWGAANGYEVSPDQSFFCLSGPQYNAALRDELARHTTEYGVAYYKHDFNVFGCGAEGHGHLPEPVYGREANVDAELAMFDYLRELNPSVYLNPSSGMWLSPWWLMHVDTVWMQYCSDFGYNQEVVAWEPRDWEMTYRDAMLWRNLYGDRSQFPVASIMTIGIIDGKLNRLGGEHEPLDRWANNVVVNMGRGSLLQELYITPGLLSPEQWDILAAGLKWQRRFVKQMAGGRMLPADPRWGDVYGWVHLDDLGGFACLRNPGIVGRTARVTLPELDAARQYSVRRTYPWLEDLQPRQSHGRWELEVDLEPFGVTVVEIVSPVFSERLPGARCSLVSRQPDRTTYEAWGLPGTQDSQAGATFPGEPYHLWDVQSLGDEGRRFAVRVDEGVHWRFAVAAKGLGRGTTLRLALDGVAVDAERVAGEGWELFTLRLPQGEHEVSWEAPEAEPEPFSAPACTVESYLVREAQLVRVRVSARDTHPVFPALLTPHAGLQRSTWVGPKITLKARTGPLGVAVTEADLVQATAAKLHLRVFGSQGGDDYGRKWIVLNGKRLAAVPANSAAGNPDTWEEFAIDLAPEQLGALRRDNEIAIETQTADCFKFADLALAVRLADGRWAETDHAADVWCSAAGWAYQEGRLFTDRTPPLRVHFRTTAER